MSKPTSSRQQAMLALADGTVFKGKSLGACGLSRPAVNVPGLKSGSAISGTEISATDGLGKGEVVFNTSMSGYQEILSDPSYVFQMLTFTYPHIGNVGVNEEDVESAKVQVAGVIVRDSSCVHSNFRAGGSFEDYLLTNNVVGISDVDTRALVLHLRTHGAQMGIIGSSEYSKDELVDRARALPSMEGLDLAKEVSTQSAYSWTQGVWELGKGYPQFSEAELSSRPLVVALDFGIKYNILRLLVSHGFRVKVLPGTASAAEILALNPQGVFLSNGPGDPAAVTYAIETTKALLGKLPIFGICLGHQILGHALGAPTFKLKFGHRGGNHPVRNLINSKVDITVQNHGFATVPAAIPKGVTVTHINLNDGTIEGIEHKEARAFSVQYHPESSPGPNDSRHLFAQFRNLVG